MHHHPVQPFAVGIAQRSRQQRSRLKRRVLRVRQVQQRQRPARTHTQPAVQQRLYVAPRVNPLLHVDVVVFGGPRVHRGPAVRLAPRQKNARRLKTNRRHIQRRRRHAREARIRSLRVVHAQRHRFPIQHRHRWRLVMGKLRRQPHAKCRLAQRQLLPPNFVEQPRAVAQNHRHAGHRIPRHIAKSAQTGEIRRNLVPVVVQRRRLRRTQGRQPLGVGRNFAAVHRINLHARTRRQRLSQRNRRLAQLPGVVAVRVQRRHGNCHIAALHAHLLPLQLRRNLQWKPLERRLAAVAHRHQRAHRKLVRGQIQMHVQIQRSNRRCKPRAIVHHRLARRFNLRLRCSGTGMCLHRAALVRRARENHFPIAARSRLLLAFRLRCGLRGSRRSGLRGTRKHACGQDSC